MPQTTIDELGIVAQNLLDAVVTILATTDSGVPPSSFITTTRPAFDCEFTAVQVERLAEDDTSPLLALETKKRDVFGNIIVATYVIYVLRCAPAIVGGNLPSDAAKTDNALLIMQDGWALWNGIRSMQDDLFDNCLGVYFDGGSPINEQGGYLGWEFQIRASIEGYDA